MNRKKNTDRHINFNDNVKVNIIDNTDKIETFIPSIKNINNFDNYPGNIEYYKNDNQCNHNNMIDGDERLAYHNINRNEPTRVINGMNNSYKNLNKYIKDEIDESEKMIWWNNLEY